MSPEQLSDSKSVDERSDIYSLGASMYVLLTHATVRDLFRIADDPSRVEGIPEPLIPVLRRSLQYERQDRYASAEELQAALRALLPELPEVPEDTSPLPRRSSDDKPGVPAGEFTELQGMLETTMPTFTDEVTRPPPDQVETPILAYRAPAPLDVVLAPPPPAPEVPRPRPLPPPPRGPSLFSRLASGALWSLVLIGLPVLVALVATPLLLGSGRSTVLQSLSVHKEAERVLLDRVGASDELPAELLGLGLDAEPAVRSFDAFQRSSDADRLEAARAFVDAISTAARPLSISGGPRGHEFELARQRVQRLEWSAKQLDEAREGWDAATRTPLGRLAVGAGLAPAP